MDQKSHNVLISYDHNLYDIPSDLEERFEFLTKKIDYAKSDPDYYELLAGTKIIFNCEFDKYECKS
jgi:hypothetical protein